MKASISLFSLVLFLFASTGFSQTQVVLENDFEKGTQNWEARGTGSVRISGTKKEAANGEKSLRITGRQENWQGAQLNLTKTLKQGQTYEFTVSVKLAKKEKPDEIKMTMQRGDNVFTGVGATTANADGWTTFSGKFKPDGNDPYLLLYVEATRERTSFFIDDFKITSVEEIPEQKGVLIKNDFEDSTAQDWFIRGTFVQIFSTNAGGSQSLKISGRSDKTHGFVRDLSKILFKDRTYQISADVKLVEGETPDKLKIVIQQTNAKGEISNVEVASAEKVTDADWVTLKGTFTPKEAGNSLVISIEAEGAKTSYYLDNFELSVP